MSSFTSPEESDMNQNMDRSEQQFTDIESYRKLVLQLAGLRRYKSALFWAEKTAVLSNNYPKDVYQLAQCMFMLKEYNRAAHVIRSSGLEKNNLLCLALLVECLYESKEYEEALTLLTSIEIEDLNTSLHNETDAEAPVPLSQAMDPNKTDVLSSLYLLKAKILESMDKRSLAIDCYIQALQKSVYLTEALDALMQHEMLMAWEEKDLLQNILPTAQQANEVDVKILTHLYESKLKKYYTVQNQNHPEKTPDCGMYIDIINEKIKNKEVFEERKSIGLSTSTTVKCNVRNFMTPANVNIMSPANRILMELKNTSASSFSIQSSLSRISMLNTSRLANTSRLTPVAANIKNLGTALSSSRALECLEQSVDVRANRAEELFYNCEYKKCIKVVESILERDPYHKKTLFVQIGCLMELRDSNALFYMAHKLVDFYPDEAISWYAVGCYYDLINKTEQGRRYFTKAASLDRLFGPAWLAYGHSFAKEKEHDQAMAAYFKAAQLMRGCHLPLMYIGVESGLTKNFEMAEKFFYQAMALAPLDVFVLHELGVSKYESNQFHDAEDVFQTTLRMVNEMCSRNNEPLSDRWEPLLNNLGHCCRKTNKLEKSLQFHKQALSLKPLNSQTYTAIGFVQALMGKLSDAIESFHKSLALKRDDVITSTILKTILEDLVEELVEEDLPPQVKGEPLPTVMEIADQGSIKMAKEHMRKLKFDDNDESDQSADMSLDV